MQEQAPIPRLTEQHKLNSIEKEKIRKKQSQSWLERDENVERMVRRKVEEHEYTQNVLSEVLQEFIKLY